MCCTRGLIDKSMETCQSIVAVPQPVAGLAMLHTVPQSVPQANTLFTVLADAGNANACRRLVSQGVFGRLSGAPTAAPQLAASPASSCSYDATDMLQFAAGRQTRFVSPSPFVLITNMCYQSIDSQCDVHPAIAPCVGMFRCQAAASHCVFIGRRSATLHRLAALIPAARSSDALPVAGRCMARSAEPAAAAAVSVAARSVSASVFMRAVAAAAAAAPAAARAAGAAAATIHGSAAAGAASRNDMAASAPALDTETGDEPPEVLPMRQAIQRATALPWSPEVEEAVLRFWSDRGLLLNEDQIDSATVR